MKRFLALILSFLTVAVSLFAKVQIGDLFYNLDSENKIAEVTDNVVDYGQSTYSGEIVIPSSVEYEGVTYDVTRIGSSAFSGSVNLLSIEIPESVTSIGGWAFTQCTGLTSITIPSSVVNLGGLTFYGCQNLTSVTILSNEIVKKQYVYSSNLSYLFGYQVEEYILGDQITEIGEYAFANSVNLLSLTLSKNTTSIDSYAFYGCSSLESVYFQGTIDDWLQYDYTGITKHWAGGDLYIGDEKLTNLVIPSTIENIRDYTFNKCKSIQSVAIGSKVNTIGDCAFDECSNLNTITISNSVVNIGKSSFGGCKNLKSIDLPESLKNIGECAFIFCISLERINIPYGITSIKYGTFKYCDNLLSINFPATITSIEAEAFYGCANMKNINIPDNVTIIADEAFAYCGLTSIDIPANIKFIGQNAFNNCANLTSVTIQSDKIMQQPFHMVDIFGPNIKKCVIDNHITILRDSAFIDCSNLSSLTLPEELTHIGNYVIANCYSLKKFTISEHISSIGEKTFAESYLDTLILNSPTIVESNNREEWPLPYVKHIIIGDKVTRIGNRFFDRYINYDYSSGNIVVELSNSVTSIGEYAFSDAYMPAIDLPESITRIGEGAFSNSSIQQITIPENVDTISRKMFFYCRNLKTAELKQGVKHIEDSAFFHCEHLESIILPEGLISIGKNAFEGCYNLKNIIIPNSVEFVGKDAFKDCTCYEVYDNIRYIGPFLIEVEDKTQESYSIKTTTKWIAHEAFRNCENLYSITIPEGVIDIEERAFFNCSMLRQINLPSTLQHIGAWAFNGTFYANKEANWEEYGLYIDKYLLNVSRPTNSSYYYGYSNSCLLNIKEGTYLVADSAAVGAYICEVTIPSSLKRIGAGAFANNSSEYYSLKELNLPETLEYIGERAFAGNKIFSISVPSTIPFIGKDAFKGVTNILYNGTIQGAPWGAQFLNAHEERGILYESTAKTHVLTSHDYKERRLILPNSVTKIREKAFYENSYIHTIVLGPNIVEIGEQSLYCYNLDTIYSYLKEPIAIPSNAFGWIDHPNTLLYVPTDKMDAYLRTEVWREFDIVPMIADIVSTDEGITIITTEDEAIITVELQDGATTYELTVSSLDGILVATYTYNSNGELISSVFHSPARVQQTAFQFIVSGLDSGHTYSYVVVAKGSDGMVIDKKEGYFMTKGNPMDADVVTDEGQEISHQKVLCSGLLYILRDGVMYNAQGARVE